MFGLEQMGIETHLHEEVKVSFEYRGTLLSLEFGETKHGEPTAVVSVDQALSTTSMSCTIRRYLWDHTDDSDPDLVSMVEQAVNEIADDSVRLSELTAHAHRVVEQILNSHPIPYVVDHEGIYALEWNGEQLTIEVRRSNGTSYMAVGTSLIDAGGFTAQAERHLSLEQGSESLCKILDEMAQTAREETAMWNRYRFK